jgi:hypothetical protein
MVSLEAFLDGFLPPTFELFLFGLVGKAVNTDDYVGRCCPLVNFLFQTDELAEVSNVKPHP